MIKYMLILSLVINKTLEVCGVGCLKCNQSNQCLFCDVVNKFYLFEYTCKFSTLVACRVLTFDGQCAQCEDNYYLDPSTKKCVVVENKKLITNCLYYGGNQNCLKCSLNYFISEGRCLKVNKSVDNCESYSGDGICSECAKGFIFNSRRNGCNKSPEINSCYAYTYLECKACASGYIANQNLYLTKYSANVSLIQSEMNASTNGQYRDWTSLEYCQKVEVKNCLIAGSYDSCTKCKDRFFLTPTKVCRAYPNPAIDFCDTYNSNTTCSNCQSGYYLESNSKCTRINELNAIPNCASYNSSANFVQCVKCVDIRFLNNNDCLSARVDSLNITNCKATSITSDTCSTCETNYILTTDAKRCLNSILNCAVYESSSMTTPKLTCKTCVDRYYLNIVDSITTCLLGEIEGCLKYSSKATCASCNNTAYYLSEGNCTKHVSIANCFEYSDTDFNQCKRCVEGYFPFRYHQTCSQISVIFNCATYQDENTCNACNDGYFLKGNQCLSINGTFPFCKTLSDDGSVCLTCVDGYALKILPSGRTCARNHDYIIDYCDIFGSNVAFKNNYQIDNDSCRVCKENSYPILLSNLFVCIDNSLLITRGVDNQYRVTGCLKYNTTDAIPFCVQCPVFLYISYNNPSACVDTCDPMINTFIADNLNGFFNTCASHNHESFGLFNCAEAIRVYRGDSISLECIKGKPDFLLGVSIDNNVNNPSCYKDIQDSTVPRPQGAFFYQGFYTTVYEKNSNSIKHDNQGDGLKDCELYYDNDGSLNCIRCLWGYSVVFDSDTNFSQCALISDCDTSTSYTGFSMVLNRMLSCHSCTNGKVLTVYIEINEDTVNYVQNSFIDKMPALQCTTPSNSNSNINSPLLVSNCLIYGWFKVFASDPTIAKGCLACMPGFKLTENFGSCMEIANCDKTKRYMANRCSACTQTNSNNEAEYKVFKDHYAESCHLVNTDNCLFANYVDGVQGNMDCKVCKPGFWLNYDKRCERIALSKCSKALGLSNPYNSNQFNSVDKVAEYYTIIYFSQGVALNGCDACEAGYTGFKLPTNEKQCVSSPYVQANTFNDVNQLNYITDCAKYQIVDSERVARNSLCEECKSNKIPNSTREKCVPSVYGCKIASAENSSQCSECLATHVFISGLCFMKNIENCSAYNESANVRDLACTDCQSGFVLASNKKSCYKGNVTACKKYDLDLPWACNTCLDKYALVQTDASKTYCIKINEESNCVSLNHLGDFNLQNGFYNCDKCSANNSMAFIPRSYPTINLTREQSLCLKLNQIDHCIGYGTNATLVNKNSFLCKICSPDFYLYETNNTCLLRKQKPLGCAKFYANKDKCETCGPLSLKSADETECISFSFAVGIQRCKTYSSDTICTGCYPPAYLENNKCILSTVINNCASYSQNYTCDACDTGYFLSNSTSCVPAKAQNCYTYTSINACETCNPDDKSMGLKTESNGIVNCVSKNVPLCDIATDVYPFQCIQCKTGYYASNEGICSKANNIDKCLVYESEVTCKQCEPLTVLSADKQNCDEKVLGPFNDPNCADSRELATPSCSKCSPGFLFHSNSCSACLQGTYLNSCFSCDPYKNATCSICMPGYFQLPNERCIGPDMSILDLGNTNNIRSNAYRISFFIFIFLWLNNFI